MPQKQLPAEISKMILLGPGVPFLEEIIINIIIAIIIIINIVMIAIVVVSLFIIANALSRAIQVLASGHMPPSLHASHAVMVGIPLSMHEGTWAIPMYERTRDQERPGGDLLKAVTRLLEVFQLLEPERPPPPKAGSVAVFQHLRRSKQELNWEKIMKDTGARAAFYEMIGQTAAPAIETIPQNMAVALDNYGAFWSMESFMCHSELSWQHNIDVSMLPMDISNPKGAECPRHTATDRKREREHT